jgi:hypothetical protein
MEGKAQTFTDRFRVTVAYHKTDLLSADDLPEERGFDGMVLAVNPSVLEQSTVEDYLFRVPGFFDAKDESETVLRLSLFQPTITPFETMNDTRETQALFAVRVIEARDEQPPESLDEVRAHVERDVRIQRAMAASHEWAQRLYAAAYASGLRAALDSDSELKDMLIQKAKAAEEKDKTDDDMDGAATDEDEEFEPCVAATPFAQYPSMVPVPYMYMIEQDRWDDMMGPSITGLGRAEPVVNAAFAMAAVDYVSPAPPAGDAADAQDSARGMEAGTHVGGPRARRVSAGPAGHLSRPARRHLRAACPDPADDRAQAMV